MPDLIYRLKRSPMLHVMSIHITSGGFLDFVMGFLVVCVSAWFCLAVLGIELRVSCLGCHAMFVMFHF